MLRSITDMLNCNLLAKDGEFGKVGDIFLDDQNWTVRYIVVETSEWLPNQRLLLPMGVLSPD